MLKYHIQTVELTSTQASISLNEVPQTYDDLILTISGRSTRSGEIRDEVQVRFNQDSNSNYTLSGLRGSGSSIGATASNGNSALTRADMPAGNATANTFSNISYYISNYKTSTAKSVNIDTVMENNATDSFMYILAGLWNNTAPITNISMRPEVASFSSGTSVSLYGVRRGSDGVTLPAAQGGVVTTSGGYTIHTFNTSGTFLANRELTVDSLVIAGGAGGGGDIGAGGGAGGYREFTSQNILRAQPYSVIVGAGGAGALGTSGNGTSSIFNDNATAGGGGGTGANGLAGGSGGGGRSPGAIGGLGNTPATTPSQGNNGGNGAGNSAGGGGGAGAAGQNASQSTGGNGGLGQTSLITGAPVLRAGGGGGLGYLGVNGTAQGGGGAGGGFSGTANTGGGGGGGNLSGVGGNGGSGVVIIRYLTP
jgi:hypothetical protein